MYFTLPCLVLQDQQKAEETAHPKIPLHFILSQPHTHTHTRSLGESHNFTSKYSGFEAGRKAERSPVQYSFHSPQLYLLALLSLPRHARTQRGLVKL
jgi:hypothetical protein